MYNILTRLENIERLLDQTYRARNPPSPLRAGEVKSYEDEAPYYRALSTLMTSTAAADKQMLYRQPVYGSTSVEAEEWIPEKMSTSEQRINLKIEGAPKVPNTLAEYKRLFDYDCAQPESMFYYRTDKKTIYVRFFLAPRHEIMKVTRGWGSRSEVWSELQNALKFPTEPSIDLPRAGGLGGVVKG